MLRVDLPKKRPTFTFLPILLLSLSLHLALYLFIERSDFDFRTDLVGASRFEFAVRERQEAIEQEPPRANDPEPPQPEEQVARRPKPNRSNRIPDKPDEQDSEPQTSVFGATAESVIAGGTGPAIRVGNTLQKRMEKAYTPPKQVAELEPPAAEPSQPERFDPVPNYRLSRMPTFEKKVEPSYPEEARRAGLFIHLCNMIAELRLEYITDLPDIEIKNNLLEAFNHLPPREKPQVPAVVWTIRILPRKLTEIRPCL